MVRMRIGQAFNRLLPSFRVRISALGTCVFLLFTTMPLYAQTEAAESETSVEKICALIKKSAQDHGLPPDFFARLIWKESRFDVRAISPAGAQGIAQFMPATAQYRGLDDSFDIESALPASASYLADLRDQFGNLGLAAAAYNGGETRLDSWLTRGGFMPLETVNYVLTITGEPIETFIDRNRSIRNLPIEPGREFDEACVRLPIIPTRSASMAEAPRLPWAVQVAGNFRRSAAETAWQRVRQRHGTLFEGLPVGISQQRTALGRKAIYAVRVGFASRGEAQSACNRLRSRGGSCIVMKN